MERPVVRCAVAEESYAHTVSLEQFERVTGAGGLEDARPDDAAGAHHAKLWCKKMHTAAAAA